jgi:hypothetical protein
VCIFRDLSALVSTFTVHSFLFTMVFISTATTIVLLLVSSFLLLISPVDGFIAPHHSNQHLSTSDSIEMSMDSSSSKEQQRQDDALGSAPPRHPFCDLPGDPSLILTTNVDLGSKKLDIMKGKRDRLHFLSIVHVLCMTVLDLIHVTCHARSHIFRNLQSHGSCHGKARGLHWYASQ